MNLPSRFVVSLASAFCFVLTAAAERTRSFDQDWRFLRGDAPGAEAPSFDDSGWRTLDVPHDYSIEDLPPRPDALPELEAASGEWRFKKGDDEKWKAADLDDGDWRKVTLPGFWEGFGQSEEANVYGWFRRSIELPEEFKGKDFQLLLGKIDDADETWVNGVRIGGMGAFPPGYATAFDQQRRYRVPASLVVGKDRISIAVRVFDGEGYGGIYEAGVKGGRIGPFDSVEPQNRQFTGFTTGGIGWYRKHFTLKETGKKVSVIFDGVYMNPELWINGRRLGEHPHGYTAFEFDLTPHLKPAGQDNVLAVKVRNEGWNSRWYTGSGIYRHVWLKVADPVHVPTWGVFVTTPQVSKDKAKVHVSTEVANTSRAEVTAGLRIRLLDADGKTVGSSQGALKLPAGNTLPNEQAIEVSAPKLWSPDSPSLYSAEVEVVVGGKTVDSLSQTFGIRSIEASAKNGFLLNGEPILLKGGCIHHDNGPLGAVAIDRAEERKVELLKANGFNAIRSAHNPPSSALLEACDRLGMLMIDEAFDVWHEPKESNNEGYQRFFDEWHASDIASMVRRDRNHPAVIMYSIGNEIPEQFRAEETQKMLREEVLKHDTTRFVTQGICNYAKENSDPGFKHLDIGGYNYLPDQYEVDHKKHPERIMFCTESFPKDAFTYWKHVEDKPYVIGDFVWTAMDYLGEAGLAHAVRNTEPNPFFMGWPWFNAWSGDLDLCGFKKPQSFYRDVVWGEREIAMLVHEPIPDGLHEVLSWWAWPKEYDRWNWPGLDGKPLQVSVYTRCDKVRLELNGEVIGEQPVSEESKLTARFQVPYQPGELKAIGLRDGKAVAETVLETTGPPAALRLTADRDSIRADRNDLSYVTVEAVDAEGRRVPDARVRVKFTVSGAGELAGQASAVPNEPASFRTPERETYEGRCLAILRPSGKPGTIEFRAEAGGLTPASLVIHAE